MTDDAELVRRTMDGDTEAYGQLVNRYQSAVYATAYYYVGRHGAVEDIAQDAFLAGYKSLARLKDPTRFGPWIKEVTSRTAANWLRSHGKRLQNETPLPHRRQVHIEDAREGPAQVFERAERIERVQRAIDSLPEQYRLPVVLRYLQDLNYSEIAQFTGMTRDEVRGILYRAGRQLRQVLAEHDARDAPEQGDVDWHRARK